MNMVFARRLIAVACIGAFGIIGTACLPAGVTLTTGGGGNTCPEGTWQLASETIPAALQTALGSATVTGSSGVSLILTTSTWSLKANQNLQINGGSSFNVAALVNATASGMSTVNGSNITFTLQNLTGTASASGSAFGQPFSTNWTLGQSGEIQELYGLSGTAGYSCSTDGSSLTLSLPAVQMQFKQ
jgi:hypothetical protein